MKIVRRPAAKPETLGLALYDKMLVAIAECHRIDEVKEIHDRVAGLEKYARQAKNYDAELRAMDVRIRASQRAGELIAELPKATGARGNPRGRGARIVPSPTTTAQQTLKELGITRDQSSQWQQLAGIPAKEVERHLPQATGERTSVQKIIKEVKRERQKPDPAQERLQKLKTLALRVWGRMRELPGVTLDAPLADVVEVMDKQILDDLAVEIPRVREFVSHLEREMGTRGRA